MIDFRCQNILPLLVKAGATKMILKSDEVRVNGDWAADRAHYEILKGEEQMDNGK